MSKNSETVYQRVVKITHIYLGPAADRFIDRQIQNHLHKEPSELAVSDLSVLTDWIRVAVAMLTDDSEIVEEYILQLERIANPPKSNREPAHEGSQS
jgi:hypothetical protein